MIYKNEQIKKQEYLTEKKENNNLAINDFNELRKKMNKAALVVIGICIVLMLPILLYTGGNLPINISFYPILMSTLLSISIGGSITVTTIIVNILIGIIKLGLNLSNKKLDKKLQRLNSTKINHHQKEIITKNIQPIKTKTSKSKNNEYSYQYNNKYTPNFILLNEQTTKKNNNIKRKILKK